MANEYDTLIDQSAPAVPANEYLDMIDGDREGQKSALKESMYAAVQDQPDRRARVLELSQKSNIPAEIVERNFDMIAKKVPLETTDYDDLIDRTPRTAGWMQDKDNAAVAHDDLDNLTQVEDAVNDHATMSTVVLDTMRAYAQFAHGIDLYPTDPEALKKEGEGRSGITTLTGALNSGLARLKAGVARVPALLYDAGAIQQNVVAKITGIDSLKTQSPEWLMNNPTALRADAVAQGYTVPEMNASITTEIGKGNYSRAGMALAAQFVSNAPQQAAIIGATVMGAGLPALIGAGLTTAADVNKRNRDDGVEPTLGTVNALAHGTAEAGLEELGTFRIVKEWSGAIASKYGKQVASEVVKDFSKTILAAFAQEGAEEALTSVAQDLSDYIMGINPDALNGLGQRALDAGVVGGFSGTTMTGPAAVGAGIARSMEARQASMTKKFYLSLAPTLEGSKLRSRLPEAQRSFVESVVKDSPVENIYVSVPAVESYFQSAKVNPTKAMQDMGVLQAFEEAKETGTDLKIPLATWANKVVGTPHYEGLANDVKFDPGAYSVNEIQAAHAETKDQVKAADADATAASNAEAETPEARAKASSEKVRSNITEQLKAAGFEDNVADTYAQVVEAGFKTLGQRAGIDPLELFGRYGLTVQRAETPPAAAAGTTTMNQSAREIQTTVPMPETVNVVEADQSRIPGELFGATDTKESKRPLQNAAKEFVFREFQNKSFTNAHTGWDIQVTRKGIKHAFGKAAGPGNILALTNLDQMLEHAVLLHSEPDRMGRDENIKAVHFLYSKLAAGDRSFLVKLIVRETKEGQKFYDQAVIEKELPADQPLGADEPSVKDSGQRSINIDDFLRDVKDQQASDPFFQDGGESPRGQIRFGKDRQFSIDLFKHFDLSTFLHETGHFYMEVMGDLAQAEQTPQQLKDDYAEILKWLGVESRDQVKTEHHEKWARGFEAYLMEGKAPTSSLRQAFARIRTWLTAIYRRMKNLDVELSPEVRGVLDRMLASEDEITAVYGEMNAEPLFTDPKSFGMTGAKLEAYERARTDARAAAEDQVNRRLIADFRRSEQEFYQDKRKGIHAAVEAELAGTRQYRALSILQKGLMPDGSPAPADVAGLKISRDSVIAAFGKDALKSLPRGLVAKEGTHIEIVADVLSFGSGTDLMKSLSGIAKVNDAVEAETDRRMAEFYPDSLTDGTLSEEALKAVHNDDRAKLLRLELEHLASNDMPVLKDIVRRITRRVPSDKVVREQAQRIVGAKKLSELSPYLYQKAEARAAKEAGEALARGDFDAAFEAKRRELLNHELFRAATDARETVEKNLKDFRKISKTDEKLAKSRDIDLVNAARALLAQFGIGRADQAPAAYLEHMKQYDPDTYESVRAVLEAATVSAGNYRDISYSDFQALAETVDTIWDLSKTTRQIEIDGKMLDREEIRAELEARLDEISTPGTRAGYDRAVSTWDRTKMGLLGWRAALRRAESWTRAVDGGDQKGAFTKYFTQPVMEATTRYRIARNTQLQGFLALLKPIQETLTVREINATELGYTFSGKSELLGAILHTGNNSNLEKLLRGRNWGSIREDGTLERGRWDGFVQRMWNEGVLTKADYDFVQGVWDLLEQTKPQAQKAHKRMYGYYFNEVTANAVSTPFGEYRGGYVPAMTDTFIVEDAAIRADKQALEQGGNNSMFPTTGRGFTKSRVNQYAAPLAMDLRLIPSHLDKVMRFVHIEPIVKEVGRIVMHKGFRQRLGAFDSEVASDLLVPWLQRAAQQKVMTPSQGRGGKYLDLVAKELRRRAGMQAMVLNVTNALQNFTGLSLAALQVKPHRLASALWTYMRAPGKTSAAIAEKSDFMRTRLDSQMAETQKHIDDIILDPSKFDTVRDSSIKHGYFLQVVTQNVMEVVTWSGAYDQAVAGGATEIEAVRAADAAVRHTQGAMNPEDVSRAETGTAFQRLFTMFYSYFNMHANLLGTEFSMARDMGLRKGAGRALYIYAMGIAVPAAIGELIVRAMSGKGVDEDDDGEYAEELLPIIFGSQFRLATAMFPFVGPTISAGVNRWNDKMYDDRITTSPAVSTIESAVGSPHSVYEAIKKGRADKSAIRDSLTAIGMLTGLPTAALARPLSYLSDVSAGKAKPEGPVDFARGLVTGKPGGK